MKGAASPAASSTAGSDGPSAAAAGVQESRRASAASAAAAATAARVRGRAPPPTSSGAGRRRCRAAARDRRGRKSKPPPGRCTAAASVVAARNEPVGRRKDGGRERGAVPVRTRRLRIPPPPAVATAGVHGGATRARPRPSRRVGVSSAPFTRMGSAAEGVARGDAVGPAGAGRQAAAGSRGSTRPRKVRTPDVGHPPTNGEAHNRSTAARGSIGSPRAPVRPSSRSAARTLARGGALPERAPVADKQGERADAAGAAAPPG